MKLTDKEAKEIEKECMKKVDEMIDKFKKECRGPLCKALVAQVKKKLTAEEKRKRCASQISQLRK